MYSALVVDDEELARRNLKGLLSTYCTQVTAIFTAGSVREALSVIEQKKIDFIFLDINLGRELGFRLIEHIAREEFAVIFVTAHQEFGLRAIKASALDYLLKPVDIDELKAAVMKACAFINRKHITADLLKAHALNTLQGNLSNGNGDIKLIITHGAGFNVLEAKKIIYAEADGNYTTFHVEGFKKIVSSKQIGYYEELLLPPSFFRSHKSYIINLKFLNGYSSRDGYTALMTEGYHVPVSRRKLSEFLDLCKNLQMQ